MKLEDFIEQINDKWYEGCKLQYQSILGVWEDSFNCPEELTLKAVRDKEWRLAPPDTESVLKSLTKGIPEDFTSLLLAHCQAHDKMEQSHPTTHLVIYEMHFRLVSQLTEAARTGHTKLEFSAILNHSSPHTVSILKEVLELLGFVLREKAAPRNCAVIDYEFSGENCVAAEIHWLNYDPKIQRST